MRKYLALAFLLCSCAGNPSLPEREIDRPYTLPADTKAFSIGAAVGRVKNTEGHTVTLFGVPGTWSLPISETWTWDLLTMVRHQFHHGERDTTGVRFGAGAMGYSSLDGFIVAPTAEFYYKRLLSENFALENTIGGDWLVRTRLPHANGWQAFAKVAPLFQLDDTKALSVSVGVALVHRYSRTANAWSLNLYPDDQTRVTMPLATSFSWRFAHKWEGDLAYSLNAIGHAKGYVSQTLGLLFHYYW